MKSFNSDTIVPIIILFLVIFIPILIYDFIKKKLYKKDLWHKYNIFWHFIFSILLIAIGVYILYPTFQDISWDNWPWDTFRENFWAESVWYWWTVALLVGIPYFINTLLRAIFGKIYIEFFFELFLWLFFIVLSCIDIVYQVKLWNTYKWDLFWISLWLIFLIIWINNLVLYLHRLNLKRNWAVVYMKSLWESRSDLVERLNMDMPWRSIRTFRFDSWKIIIESDMRYLNWVEWYLSYVSIVPVFFDINNPWEFFMDPYWWKKVSWNVDKKLQSLNEPTYKEMIKSWILSETMPENRRKRIWINSNSLSKKHFYCWFLLLILSTIFFLFKIRILWLIILVFTLPYLITWLDWFLPYCRRKNLVKNWERIEGNIISINKTPRFNKFLPFSEYFLEVTDGKFIYKSPIVYLNNIFHVIKIWDYIPIYRNDKSVRIDVNWIRTNEDKFKNNYKWLEIFNQHNEFFVNLEKISHYCVNIFDVLFFFLQTTLIFNYRWWTKK